MSGGLVDELHDVPLDRENQDLKEILEIAFQITAQLEVENIVKNVVWSYASKFQCDAVTVVLGDPVDEQLVQVIPYAGLKRGEASVEFPPIGPMLAFLEKDEFSQLAFSYFSETYPDKGLVALLESLSTDVIVPLRTDKGVLGFVLLTKSGMGVQYGLLEIEYITRIARFAAIAIENASLFRQATTDRMTGLFSHHYFEKTLEEEMERARRYKATFSLVMFDIDNFKKFNDTYGHLAGDRIIREISKLLTKSVRQVDFPARYGGEEFAVILPAVDVKGALVVAERLRRKVEQYRFPGDGEPLHVTISVGVTEFDAEATYASSEIVREADRALYQSKEPGQEQGHRLSRPLAMVVVLERGIREQDKNRIREFLAAKGYTIREIVGEEETILGAVGVVGIDTRQVELLPGVARVIPISSPYKLASREFRKDDTVVPVGTVPSGQPLVRLGGLRIVVIAGPCAVESREQVLECAALVRESGAVLLRGGAYKPRTSPYAFQGLGEKALQYLKEAGERCGMPVVSEILSPEHVPLMRDYVDVLQIGTRNMQNFDLLKKVGALGKPVLLKRGQAATIQDLLMSAEYLLAAGTDWVILCERGIRTFETATRNTLDLSAIPVVKKLSHLPIVVDPSHGTGLRAKVSPMALAAVAAGADGITVEVHPDPDRALSDGPQSLYPQQFEKLMRDIEALAPVLGKEIARLPEPAPAAAGTPGGARGVGGGPASAGPGVAGTAVVVAFQGERGAFSEQAVLRHFTVDVRPQPVPEFPDVFDAVLAGRARFGVIPIENSLTGSIHQNYDLLLQYPDVRIVGEQKIRIVHALIGLPGTRLEDIRRVYSHPQGLAQCSRFLDGQPWERVAHSDTAGAVRFVAESGAKENAAIASEEACPGVWPCRPEAGHRDQRAELHPVFRDRAGGGRASCPADQGIAVLLGGRHPGGAVPRTAGARPPRAEHDQAGVPAHPREAVAVPVLHRRGPPRGSRRFRALPRGAVGSGGGPARPGSLQVLIGNGPDRLCTLRGAVSPRPCSKGSSGTGW